MLQIQTVKPECLAVLKELMSISELKDFRLAGGTGLSLRLGHRVSIDLDLFTNQLFNPEEFQIFLENHFNNRVGLLGSNKYGVFTAVDSIKVDFLYRHEKFSDAEHSEDGFRIANLNDIAAMKILAASNRGSKKDYYDLHELLNVYTFAELIDLFKVMYPNYGIAGIIKSIADFNDAESEDDPISLKKVAWINVKENIAKEIRDFIHSLQQQKQIAESKRQKAIEEIISRKKSKK